jgi:hypothetical protein
MKRKYDSYDASVALLDTALTLKKVADVILSDERCLLAALEDIIKRMDRMEDMLGIMQSRRRWWVDNGIH